MRIRSRRWRVLKVWAALLTNACLNLFGYASPPGPPHRTNRAAW